MADLNSLLTLIPSANRDRPQFRAWVSTLLQGLVDAANVAESMQTLFDIDNAVGDQLDKVGEWVGVSRLITEKLAPLFFSWGVAGLGWGQANWASPFEPPNSQIVSLDDSHYRILLKARIAANYWDGTIPGAYEAWDRLFAAEGYQVLIQNVQPKALPPNAVPGSKATGNMHILLGLIGPPIDALTQALFTGGYLDLRSAGVAIDAYFTQSVPGAPIFAWGVGPTVAGVYASPPTNFGGWGIGAWANFSQAPVAVPMPRPNLSADTSVVMEVASGTVRADSRAPLTLLSKPLPTDRIAPIETR